MSTLKVNNLQVGQDSTATNNLTWFQPGSPDGTIRLGSGNAGSATTKFTFDKDGNLTCVGDITANSIIAPIEGTLDDWIVHAGDTNTKFGFSANDTFQVQTGGSGRVTVTDSATTVDNDLRIVNTSGPLLELTTNGNTADATLRLSEGATGTTNNGGGMYYSGADNKLYITCGTNSTTKRITIQRDDGKIGMGIAAPLHNLHIKPPTASETVLKIEAESGYDARLKLDTSSGGGAEARIDFEEDASIRGWISYTNNSGGTTDDMVFGTATSERLRIGATGLHSITATTYEALKITTNANGNNGPEVQLIHNSASPAANDCIGQLRFSGKDSAGNTDLMARIETIIDSPTSGDESAHLNFAIRGQSAFNTTFRIKRRGTASAPSYTADDIDGIIYDTYNEGSGSSYARHMSLIAKAAGNSPSNLSFWTEAVGGSPTEKLRITPIGRVGINETNPEGLLHIDGESNDPYIYLQRSGAGDTALDLGGIIWKNDTKYSALIKCRTIDRDDAELIFETMYQDTRAEKLRIKNDGKLMTQSAGWIYTNSSAGSLTLGGGNTNLGGKIVLSGGNSPATGDIKFCTGLSSGHTPTERVHINNVGNVLIKNSTTSSSGSHENNVPLCIDGGTNKITMMLGDASTSVSGHGVNDYSGDIRFNGANIAWGDIAYYPMGDTAGGSFRFTRNGSTVTSQANAHIGVEGVFIDGTSAANNLDHYEEGTWTPKLMDGNGSNVTFSNGGNCRFTRIGNLVYCYFNVTRAETGSKTGHMRFWDLPFTAENVDLQVTGTWWLDHSQTSGEDAVGGAIYVVQNTKNAYFVYPTTEFQPIGNSYRYVEFSHWNNGRPMYGSFTYRAA